MGALENMKKLPEVCYSRLRASGEVICIKRGEMGYTPVSPMSETDVDAANVENGCNKAQRAAMEIGSMFGWHVPGADADIYDAETGLPRKEKTQNVG